MNDFGLYPIQTAIELTERMIAMADDVCKNCEDDGTLLVFSVIRDSAYKIRRIADKENQKTEVEYLH